MRPYVYLLGAFGLVLLNAFFVAAEFAIVKIRSSRLETLVRSGAVGAAAAQHAIQHLDVYLSATQLGITLSSLGLGWIGEPAFVELIDPLLLAAGIDSPRLAHTMSVTTAFATITFLHLVLGELAPKSLAIQKTESTVLAIALPLRFFYYVFYPILFVLNRASNGILRLVGILPVSGETLAHSEEELRILLSESARVGEVSGSKRRLLENVFTYSSRTAREIMIPRNEIAWLSLARTWEENLAVIHAQGHTRYPLCAASLDQVVGMVHMKDLFDRGSEIRSTDDLEKLKRDVLFVPESATLDQVQRQFQQKRVHMAIVVDEYGGTAGLVTLEDVLEELVGEIQDEHDREESKIQRTPEGDVVDGLVLVEDVNERLGLDLPIGEVRTLGGWINAELGRIAQPGETLTVAGRALKVVEMKGRRVSKVLIPRTSAGDAAGNPPGGG